MKRAIQILLVISLALSLSVLALADGGFDYTVEQRVRIGQDGTADIDIHVTNPGTFAGAQFEVILSDGVSIEKIFFDNEQGSGTIPPTYARGSYFFSLIAGTNEFEGDFTCTLSILYEGTEPAYITVAEIQTHYIVRPGNVETTVNDTQTVIELIPHSYLMIGDNLIPLGFFRKNWVWITAIIVVAAIVTFVLLRNRRKKKIILEEKNEKQ